MQGGTGGGTPDGAAAVSAALGKIAPDVFDALVAPHLGAARAEVLVGPGPGRDAAIVRVGPARVMSITTDPLSLVPCWGLERSARLACHLLASDAWTSGIAPQYATASFALPQSLGDDEFALYWRAMSDEWSKLGVAVVAGHTGRHAGIEGSIIGAATLVGIGDEGRYVAPTMAKSGDRVIVTKGCAIETTAIVAHLCPERLSRRLDPEGMDRARGWTSRVSVVAECRAALLVGVRDRGVSALHDATEGGVLGGLVELARAAGADLRVDRARIPLEPEAVAACETLGVDPLRTLSQGTLIATVRPAHAAAVIAAIEAEGIRAADVGEVVSGHGRLWLTEEGGRVVTFDAPEPDPYWPAYERALREGWK